MAEARRGSATSSSPVPWVALQTFERVATHLNFARAAAELAVTPTAVSKAIKQLEARLGVRLFNRTTRSVSLTEAGGRLLQELVPALYRIRDSVEQVGDSSAQPHGLLRINTSYVAYSSLIEPHLPAFLERYPAVEIDLQIDNALSDIVAGGFDAGVRLGHALQRDMIGLPLGPSQQLVVVGSPRYLERHGTPQKPLDLLGHECIRQRIGQRGRFLEWKFGSGARSTTIDVGGRLMFNEMRAALSAALRDCGLAYVFRHFAAADTSTGRLVTVLERHSPPGELFYLYYPNRSQMPGKLRAFVDFMRASNGAGA